MDQEMSWWYVSWYDQTMPEGTQFLGGAFVPAEAPTYEEGRRKVVQAFYRYGCHPGDRPDGSQRPFVLTGPISDLYVRNKVPPQYRATLLSREVMEHELGWRLDNIYRQRSDN